MPKDKAVPYDSSEVTEEWMCSTLTDAIDGAVSARRTWVYEAKHQESGMLSSIFRAKLDVTYTDGNTKEHKVQ